MLRPIVMIAVLFIGLSPAGAAPVQSMKEQPLAVFDKVRTVTSRSDGSGARSCPVANVDIGGLADTSADRETLRAYTESIDRALREVEAANRIVR